MTTCFSWIDEDLDLLFSSEMQRFKERNLRNWKGLKHNKTPSNRLNFFIFLHLHIWKRHTTKENIRGKHVGLHKESSKRNHRISADPISAGPKHMFALGKFRSSQRWASNVQNAPIAVNAFTDFLILSRLTTILATVSDRTVPCCVQCLFFCCLRFPDRFG